MSAKEVSQMEVRGEADPSVMNAVLQAADTNWVMEGDSEGNCPSSCSPTQDESNEGENGDLLLVLGGIEPQEAHLRVAVRRHQACHKDTRKE